MPIIWDDKQSLTSPIIWDDEKKVEKRKNTLEERISQRPDIYKQAAQEIQYAPEIIKQHPFQAPALPVDILLKSIGGVIQRGEATIANPFLKKERRFQNPLQAIKQGITGERLGEIGDIIEKGGIPRWTGIPAVGGLLATGVIGGALAKFAKVSQVADDFIKVETTYGKDIGKNVIKWTTGMPNQAVEHGMKRGWKNVITKENLNPTIPTKIASNVLDDLGKITIKEYDDYGKVIDKVNQGSIKARDLLNGVQDGFIKTGYLNPDGTDTIRIKPSIVNNVKSIWDSWKQNMQPDENVPISVVQSLRNMLKKKIPEANLIGKKRTLTDEQRFAKDLYNKMNEMIGFNAFGIENKELTLAKRSYRDFKNMEKAILNTFSEVTGQEVTPTADKIVGIFNLPATKSIEEVNKIKSINKFLVNKGFKSIQDKLFDWLTVQSALVQPQQGGASLYPFRLIAESTKYATRQALKTGIPSFIGRQIEKTGKGISAIKTFGKKSNIIPASGIRILRKQEE